jgi:hypothetical protein
MNVFMTTIVGTRFRGPNAVAMVGALPRGLRVRLQREPNNEFDGNAIAVYYGTAHLGFLPRNHNTDLAPALDRGACDPYAEVVAEAILDKGEIRFAPKLAVHMGSRKSGDE